MNQLTDLSNSRQKAAPFTPARLAACALAAALAAGCTVFPDHTTWRNTGGMQQESAGSIAASGTSAPSSANNSGGYYLDDGPPAGASAPANTPDAIVRKEAINPKHNQPYVVHGKRYVPFLRPRPYKRRGEASWYGKRYHGRQTASGEIYDMHQMSAAHTILPIPSYARVTRTDTGKSVVVRINDRGPFLQGREIDLSYAAAAKLGIVQSGTGEVIVEALLPDAASGTAKAGAATIPPVPAAPAQQTPAKRVAPASSAIYIQLGAYSTRRAAAKEAARLGRLLSGQVSGKTIIVLLQSGLFAVHLGPYPTPAAAAKEDQILCRHHNQCGFLTQRY